MLESAQMGLETVAGAIFDGPVEFVNIVAESKLQLHSTFEGWPLCSMSLMKACMFQLLYCIIKFPAAAILRSSSTFPFLKMD